MSYSDRFKLDEVCEICGDHIGNGFDHEECSKLKKEIYGGKNENKNPVKKMSKKQLDGYCDYINKSYE